jgi:hypothetical protein
MRARRGRWLAWWACWWRGKASRAPIVRSWRNACRSRRRHLNTGRVSTSCTGTVRWRRCGGLPLELKTTTPAGAGLQNVYVDIGQLWEYSQKRLGEQPFYAFPWPDWVRSLDAVARAQSPRKEVTELAFRRSGSGWWFGDWMVVMTARQVARRHAKRRTCRAPLPKARLPEAAGPDRRDAASHEALMGWPRQCRSAIYARLLFVLTCPRLGHDLGDLLLYWDRGPGDMTETAST